jgi:hypothetical protein
LLSSSAAHKGVWQGAPRNSVFENSYRPKHCWILNRARQCLVPGNCLRILSKS